MNLDDMKDFADKLEQDRKMQISNMVSMGKSLARKENPASWMYERLMKYITTFEKGLDNDHEIGGRLVSFGNVLTFHIIEVGYYGPDIITFDGINDNNEPVKLIQHYSQLNVLLVAVKKFEENPRRIGFTAPDKKRN